MGENVAQKISQDFQMAGNVPSWPNFGPRLSDSSSHENLRAARQINCAVSLHGNLEKNTPNKNAHSMYGGDCHAAIAKAAAAVTRVQSQSPEVGSRDEGLGLFGFDMSSTETDFKWLKDEQ